MPLVIKSREQEEIDPAGTTERHQKMSTIQDCTAEQLAKLLHHYREALAHGCEGNGQDDQPSSWDRAPQQERRMMVAAARLTLLELATTPGPADRDRRYFAKPGEAEWGC
jgi:hypothetical protein